MSAPSTPIPAMTDVALVAAARCGDQQAFAELVTRYQRPLMSRALRLTRQIEDADDLVQETFLRAWRSLGSFREDDRFGGWLFRILSNLAIDRGRHLRREAPITDPALLDVADQAYGPEESLLAEEIARAVDDALAKMPPGRQREIFELRFRQHLAVHEIAEQLGLHTGTVKVHLFRGTRQLRRALERFEGAR